MRTLIAPVGTRGDTTSGSEVDMSMRRATVRRGPATADGTLDRSWRPLYRAGAVAAGLAVLMYVVALAAFIVSAAPPTTGGTAMLEYVAAHRTGYIVRQVLWLAPSLPLMVAFLALAVALSRVDRTFTVVAGVIAVASWAVSFAWPTTGEGSLAIVRLSDQYATAATDAERASFVAGAELLMALNDTQVVIGVLQTLGILLISLLMLKGVFARGLAWLGVATGAIGIVAEALRPLLGWAYAVYGILIFAWLIWVAWALWRLGAPAADATATSVEE
jgi:hypothetical protein